MSMDRQAPPRLSPDQMMVYYLDEIAGRLADQAGEGKLESKQFTVATTWYILETAWTAATIYNDGDSDVYIRLDDMSSNPWEEGEAPLKKGESLPLRMGARLHKPLPQEGDSFAIPLRSGSPLLCFICQTGTATVRVFKLW